MKIWLDDFRKAPDGWIHCRTPNEAVFYLRQNIVDEISLDHDLGYDALAGRERNGYEVVAWIEERLQGPYAHGFDPPKFRVHTDNPVGRDNMVACIRSIEKIVCESLM